MYIGYLFLCNQTQFFFVSRDKVWGTDYHRHATRSCIMHSQIPVQMMTRIWCFISAIICVALASSDVGLELNVEANWEAPPFALQILESVAAENSSTHFPLLTALSSYTEYNNGKLPADEDLHQMIFDHVVEVGLLKPEQLPFVDASLAVHRYAALIQSHYQYYKSWFDPAGKYLDCDNVVVYNNEQPTCDVGAIFAFKTKKAAGSGNNDNLLPFDRVLGSNSDAPLVVLYADVTSEQFATFHAHLSSSALDGKIRYVVRYKPSNSNSGLKEQLTGYGVILNVKRTDYLVIDDRKSENRQIAEEDDDVERILAESTKKSQSSYKKLKETTEAAALDKAAIPLLGFRAAGHIMSSDDPFASLVDVSLNFPKYSKAISELDAGLEVSREVLRNVKTSRLGSGESLLLVNGAPAMTSDSSFFNLLDTLDVERKHVSKMASVGFANRSIARQVIEQNLIEQSLQQERVRFDYRGSLENNVQPLVWINDIELDKPYSTMSSDLSLYNEQLGSAGSLHPVRHNTHSVVFAMDLTDPEALQLLGQSLSFLMRGLPVQLGIIPLSHTEAGAEMARHVFALSQMTNPGERLGRYITMSLMGQPYDQTFQQLAGPKAETALTSEYVDELVQASEQWCTQFGIGSDASSSEQSLVFVNGVLAPKTVETFFSAIADIFSNDVEKIREYIKSDGFNSETMSESLRDWLIKDSHTGRQPLLMPSDFSEQSFVDTSDLWSQFEQIPLPYFEQETDSTKYRTIWYIADMADKDSLMQLKELMDFSSNDYNVRVNVLPIPGKGDQHLTDKVLINLNRMSDSQKREVIDDLIAGLSGSTSHSVQAEQIYHEFDIDLQDKTVRSTSLSSLSHALLQSSNPSLLTGRSLIYMGRRLVLPNKSVLTSSDVNTLVKFDEQRFSKVLEHALPLVSVDHGNYYAADSLVSLYSVMHYGKDSNTRQAPRVRVDWAGNHTSFELGNPSQSDIHITAVVNPLTERGQELVALLDSLRKLPVSLTVYLNPSRLPKDEIPLKRFYRGNFPVTPNFGQVKDGVEFHSMPQSTLFTLALNTPSSWITMPSKSIYDLDNIILESTAEDTLEATYELRHILVEGSALDLTTNSVPRGMALELCNSTRDQPIADTLVMANYGYFQLQANPGLWTLELQKGRSSQIFSLKSSGQVWVTSMTGTIIFPHYTRAKGMEKADVLAPDTKSSGGLLSKLKGKGGQKTKNADINIFSVASGHLYERFLSIMTDSVMRNTDHTVKFWFIENFLSPSFKDFLPTLAEKFGFEYELVTYKWPRWLNGQKEKQREIWGYKILFLDVLFPLSLDKVIFVDADQIVRTDLKDLVDEDLQGAPYGYTPMCDSREEMEGFRFWKQGFWEKHLKGLPYHISALYVVDLDRFRQIAAGDILRKHYQQLSMDPNSLANLDQDLPNYLQSIIPIHSLSQDWLWCETWCSDEALLTARTIDLCNNPLTKEPKLDRARRQLSEWTSYDNEVAELRNLFESAPQSAIPQQESESEEYIEQEAAHDYHEDL